MIFITTFKFTKDIADLLIRIESGFGERLKSLDEGYNSMRSIMASPRNSGVNQMKEKIEVDESELSKINAERSELINKLLEKANLEHEEKEKIKEELKIKEEESQKLQFELTKLKKRLFASRMSSRDQQGGEGFSFDSDMKKRLVQNYIASTIVPDIIESYEINASDVLLSSREIQNYFNNKHWENGKTQFAKDMVRLGYCVPGEGLTLSGARYIRTLLRTALREL